MKRLVLLIAFLLIANYSYAGTWTTCNWIWSTDVTTANDPPDSVYCKDANQSYKSKGVKYIQSTRGADGVQIQYDTTWDNSKTVPQIPGNIVPCSNTAATGDLNVLACVDSSCDTGTGTVAYHQVDDIADNIKLTFELTPTTDAFKLSVDGDTATCWVVRTTVYWE